ncbi:MAG TPA: putative DNA binding domain-containing protein [Candidatus Woesebacteria bacterium]|nr:putative DNA binding domain-containing protein [Candidatus Woesebacteria bacterium]
MKNFTDTSEKGLQRHIVDYLVENNGFVENEPKDFDKKYFFNVDQLLEFIKDTQPKKYESIINRDQAQFLARLSKKISQKGVIEVLRNGVKFYDLTVKLFYSKPASNKNPDDLEKYNQNIFSVTKELIYSDNHNNELDVVILINGIPVITSELKNILTGQNVNHAIKQYKTDRNPQDELLRFGRCMVHFAIDNDEAFMATKLAEDKTYFLPFNKGLNDGRPTRPFGKGNPDNPNDLKTSYIWQEIFTKDTLSNILSKYAQIVSEKDNKTGEVKKKLIFPRYHQLKAVESILSDTQDRGVGSKYLIQHSTGSGKSFSIVWLTYQLANLFDKSGDNNIFDTVFVVTDRRNLDEHIKEQLRAFTRVKDLVSFIGKGAGSKSDQLKEALHEKKKIVVVTVQTFPFVLEKIESLTNSDYAIIIDEAHSSQSGATSGKMNLLLSNEAPELPRDEEGNIKTEDYINYLIKGRKMLKNASYYAFTATPKNKTLETFGVKQPDGTFAPFHLYPMKQAIEEGFILDVLSNYTTYTSYYKLAKKIEGNPEFDVKKANKKLRIFVETHPDTIAKKAKIMVDHFHNNVAHRIDGKAKSMIVTRDIKSAMKYMDAVQKYLKEIKSPYKAIVAFSGSKKHYRTGEELTENKMNNFPDGLNDIPEQFKKDEYRFLIVADKFQTGFDQPLLHTMYVDKKLVDLQAVQTLSRLNRSHPAKSDTFVLDFFNETEDIKQAFEPYYTSTILSEATDPNKLNDLEGDLEQLEVYTLEDVERFFDTLVNDKGRDVLDPQLDALVSIFNDLTDDQKVEFKSKAKVFTRTYDYLSKIIDFEKEDWEKLYWLLKNLVPKLKIKEPEDDVDEILETVDINSFRPSKGSKTKIYLSEEGAEIAPIPVEGEGDLPKESEKDTLENIINEFNDRFGNIDWKEPDKVKKTLTEDIPKMMQDNKKLMRIVTSSDMQNAKITTDKQLRDTMLGMMKSQTEIYKKFTRDDDFKQRYQEFIFDFLRKESGIEDIPQLIQQGESQNLEFKSSLRWDVREDKVNKDLEKIILKTIAGFLNSEGGQLIIGVEDNGNVFGLEKDYVAISNGDRDKFENHLVQLVKTAIGVEFLKYIRFSFDSIDSKDVCLVTVVRGNKPAYVTFKGNEEFFVRTGNNTSPLGMKETQDYISDNWD